jgi:glycosyltransferase involved in cell wall biosynthesis
LKKKLNNKNIIVHDYFENFGGGERFVKILTNNNFKNLIVGFDEKIYQNFIKSKKIKFKSLINYRLPAILKKIFLLNRFKRLNIENVDNCICSGNYSIFSNLENVKNKIIYIHSLPKIFFRYNEFYTGNIIQLFILKIFFFNFKKNYILKLNNFDHIIVNSKFTKKMVEKYTDRKINVIYPPIEKFKFNKINYDSYFLFNNRHEKEKNLDKVLQAFKKLENQRLVILSKGSLTKKYKKEYLSYKNIYFKGLVSEKKYVNYLSNCMAVINVSTQEDFGMSAIEAMQFGKISICINEGGYKETTKHNYNAIHINKKKITPDLIKEIKSLKKSDLLRMKQNCLKEYKKYSERNFINKINKYLR